MSLLKRKVQAYPAPAATSSPVKLTEKDLVPIAEFAMHIKTGRLSSGLKPWLASHPDFLSDYYEARLQQAIPFFFNSGNAAQGRSYAHGSPPPPPSHPSHHLHLSTFITNQPSLLSRLSSAAFTTFKSLRAHGVDTFIRKLGSDIAFTEQHNKQARSSRTRAQIARTAL